MHKWKTIAIKQMAHKWLLIARVKSYVRAFKARVHLNAGKEKKAAEVKPPKYPSHGTSQLVLAPLFSRIKQVLPQTLGTLATRAWIQKVQEHAVQGPNLKTGLLYFEYLLRIQRDYEDMQQRYNAVRMQEFMKMPVIADNVQYQIELLTEQATNLMTQWTKYNMHAKFKCQLPAHPCQIQVLELPPELRISEANWNNSPMLRKLTTASVQ